jgi:hypothetical protein
LKNKNMSLRERLGAMIAGKPLDARQAEQTGTTVAVGSADQEAGIERIIAANTEALNRHSAAELAALQVACIDGSFARQQRMIGVPEQTIAIREAIVGELFSGNPDPRLEQLRYEQAVREQTMRQRGQKKGPRFQLPKTKQEAALMVGKGLASLVTFPVRLPADALGSIARELDPFGESSDGRI